MFLPKYWPEKLLRLRVIGSPNKEPKYLAKKFFFIAVFSKKFKNIIKTF
jgi:hypothetical protein